MKRAALANIPLPVNLWHPVHAAALPVATDDRDDLERLLNEGWYLSQDAMNAGKEPEGIDDDEDDTEEQDPVDAMLNEEDANANASSTPKKKRTRAKK